MKSYKFNLYGNNYKVTVETTTYTNNNRLAIILMCEEDGEEMPFGNLTVNIDDELSGDSATHAFVDINNMPSAEKFILDNKLGRPTGFYGISGYCTYPEYEFDIDAINSQDVTPIVFKQGMSKNDWFLDRSSLNDKKVKSITKLLGGKELVTMTRWYCKKGTGGWIYDYIVKDSNKEAVEMIVSKKYPVKWIYADK